MTRLRTVLLAGALLGVTVTAGLWAWHRSQPPRVRAGAPAGSRPIHYEEELGPRPGLLDELKRAGHVPPDAIDDGRGHFVSAATLSPAERQTAAAAVARRGRRQENPQP